MSKIVALYAREILDSRGNPTIEVKCELESGACGVISVSSGASKGIYEALELRDGDFSRYGGKGVLKAVRNVNEMIAKKLIGLDVVNQSELDRVLIDLDGTINKSNLGANACIGVSLAYTIAQSNELGLPLYEWIGGLLVPGEQETEDRGQRTDYILPIPMLNIINGGVHADNNLDIQEFMLVPAGANSFKESIRMGAEIFHSLRSLLKEAGLSTGVGDEGGFAPNLKTNREACEFIIRAIRGAGYKPGKDAWLAIDAAASGFYTDGKYKIEGKSISSKEIIDFYSEWSEEFPIFSIEDGLAEDDWEGWALLTAQLGHKILIIGDDLYVTNCSRLKKGIELKASNAILIKPNQIGTLTETLNCIKIAKGNGYKCVISHRSGETESTFISHLAVGTGVGFIKSGAPSRMERVVKYNELIRIEEELGDGTKFLGLDAFTV
ncbi:MAG: phosphopyruvate hydratase [Candidatus Stahlbacteria bacterium]|nr:phosphopyruvate hydratase [Candidatus Stahlbacteria bacterium]